MAFTYAPALPTARDRVRYKLGDVEEKRAMFPDETIDYILANVSSDETYAAWELCRAAVAKYSRDADSEGAGLRAARSQKVAQLQALCSQLEADVSATGGPVFTGSNIDVTQRLIDDDNFPGFGTRIGKSNYPGLRTK